MITIGVAFAHALGRGKFDPSLLYLGTLIVDYNMAWIVYEVLK